MNGKRNRTIGEREDKLPLRSWLRLRDKTGKGEIAKTNAKTVKEKKGNEKRKKNPELLFRNTGANNENKERKYRVS